MRAQQPSLGLYGDIRAWDARTGAAVDLHTVPRAEPGVETWEGELKNRDRMNMGASRSTRAAGAVPTPPTSDYYGAIAKKESRRQLVVALT
jgi:hypothetical protein